MAKKSKERVTIKIDSLIPLLESGLSFEELKEKLGGVKSENSLKVKILEAGILQGKLYNPSGMLTGVHGSVKLGKAGLKIPLKELEGFSVGAKFTLKVSKEKIVLTPVEK